MKKAGQIFKAATAAIGSMITNKYLICPNCGYRGKPKTKTKGSIFIEIILWLMLIIPGLIYSIWRLTSRYKICPKCGARNMIPVDSPKGKILVKQ